MFLSSPCGTVVKIGVVMSKSKKKYRRKRKKEFPVIPVTIGVLLIGFAFLAMASPKSEGNAESSNSVVPMEVNYAAPGLSLQNINGENEVPYGLSGHCYIGQQLGDVVSALQGRDANSYCVSQ